MQKTIRLFTTLLTISALAAAVFCSLPGMALAASGDTGVTDIWNWTELPDGTLEINMPTAPFSGSYILPDQLDIGQPGTPDVRNVTRIGYGAFMGSPGLTAMTLPPTLKVIGPYAFSGCTALTAITIPDSVTDIGDSAFDGCTNLQTITLPGNGSSQLASIGQNAFSECSSLESIAIPDTVTSIGPVAFINCTSLSSATLPDNPAFTAIPTGLFNGCSALDTVTIPFFVTAIGNQSFISSGISSIAIPTITTIGEQAFMDTELAAITIPSGVTSIGSMAFAACPNLTAITVDPANANYCSVSGVLYTIDKSSLLACPGATADVFQVPSGVSDIAEGAFFGCPGLTSVTMTDDVQTIGMFAFGYSGFTSITIPESVTTIGMAAFAQCTWLEQAVFLSRTVALGPNLFMASGIAADGIYGFAGSTAQAYATANSHPFHTLVTVSFDSGEGSAVGDLYVETGHTFAAPADPTRPGFVFTGWYTDEALTDLWDFDTDTVTEDMELHAGWALVLTLAATPSNSQIYVGGRITITPNISGGTWQFDPAMLSLDGNTFTGLKAGTARITYTAGAQSAYADITITASELPATGQDFSAALWLLGLAVLVGGAAIHQFRRKAAGTRQ